MKTRIVSYESDHFYRTHSFSERYQLYDPIYIFVSYTSRDSLTSEIKKHLDLFIDRFRQHLECLNYGTFYGQDVRIFYDYYRIGHQDDSHKIRRLLSEALYQSYIMIAFISPEYLCSDWCMFEWNSMSHLVDTYTIYAQRRHMYAIIIDPIDTSPPPAGMFQQRPSHMHFDGVLSISHTLKITHKMTKKIYINLCDLLEQSRGYIPSAPVDSYHYRLLQENFPNGTEDFEFLVNRLEEQVAHAEVDRARAAAILEDIANRLKFSAIYGTSEDQESS